MAALRVGSAAKEAALGAATELVATSQVESACVAAAVRRVEETAETANRLADASIAERERSTDAAVAEAVRPPRSLHLPCAAAGITNATTPFRPCPQEIKHQIALATLCDEERVAAESAEDRSRAVAAATRRA